MLSLLHSVLAVLPFLAAGPRADSTETERILARFALAWRGREEMALTDTVVMAFDVLEQDTVKYGLVIAPGGSTRLTRGRPVRFQFGYATDVSVLRKIDVGALHAGTAMMAARETDKTPMQLFFMDDVRPTPELFTLFRSVHFHFWTRGWPEVIPFGARYALPVHGVTGSILWYETGLRTLWFGIKPGMHANADPTDQVNPFPTIVLVTKGSIRAKVGGSVVLLTAGQMLMVPAGVAHELWAERKDAGGEGILIMYGPRA